MVKDVIVIPLVDKKIIKSEFECVISLTYKIFFLYGHIMCACDKLITMFNREIKMFCSNSITLIQKCV